MSNKEETLAGSNSFISPKMNNDEKNAILNDPATHLATHRGQHIEIFHIPSGQCIKFKAYIDDYQDKYDTDWQSTDVYGRMDPIHQYQGTKRVISLDWIVPAYSVAEAKLNHEKCSLLFSMLYPNYNVDGSGFSSATQISTAPLFKVKFGNLIQDPSYGDQGGSVEDCGLVGAIGGFTYSPNIDAGFIDQQGPASGKTSSGGYADGFKGQLYPKEVKLSMEYTVFHTNPLGWTESQKRTPGFPYGDAGATGAGTDASNGNQEDLTTLADVASDAANNMIEHTNSLLSGALGQ